MPLVIELWQVCCCYRSPHPVREVPLDLSIPYIDMLLGPQNPVRGTPNNTVKQEESQTLEKSQTETIVLRKKCW